MDSVLLDTNVLLDFLATARAGHATAVELVRESVSSGVRLCLAATSLKDVYYILSHSDGEPTARTAVAALMAAMTVLPVDAASCGAALASSEPDFEDGIIRAVAETAGVDFLVSRDRRAFAGSRVPRIDPADALVELRNRLS